MQATIPTYHQFKKYRRRLRTTVADIIRCHRAGAVPLNEWGRGVIWRCRAEHSASIRRQRMVLNEAWEG